MSRLTKDMYDRFGRAGNSLFGLSTRQDRDNPLFNNAGWYNERGYRLGWGDLDAEDLGTIQRELMEDERFVVLNVYDSLWEFVTFANHERNPHDARDPGVEYVTQKALCVIRKGELYFVEGTHPDVTASLGGLVCCAIKREEVRALVATNGFAGT